MDISQCHWPKTKGVFLKVDFCCTCIDYYLSNNCLEHICSGSEQARSAFMLTHIYKINNNQSKQFSSRSTNRYHLPCTLSNNRRTLSPKQRELCLRNRFAPASTLQNQEDCGPPGQQVRPNIDQLFTRLTLKTTIKIKSGKSPQRASLRYGGLFTA